jgi:O-acetyl-ADP-ribose deacetylase (regulator of RNase III)
MMSLSLSLSLSPSPPSIHFISFDKRWIDAISDLFSGCDNVTITNGNIKSLRLENTVFVSPANSLGFMDGGIDYVLSREMFPGLQTLVQDSIHCHGVENAFGRWYLPVGSAICLQIVPPPTNTYIIVAPTMFQPRDVSRTHNAYWSFLAALTVFAKHFGSATYTTKHMTLVVTSHCCGYGCMDPFESARQMHAAYNEFRNCVGTRLDIESAEHTFKVRFPPEEIDDGSCSADAGSNEVKEIHIS